jgi:hypothetical protein
MFFYYVLTIGVVAIIVSFTPKGDALTVGLAMIVVTLLALLREACITREGQQRK